MRSLEAADCRLMAAVLHPYVCWNPSGHGGASCRTRSHVLGRCARLHALGLRARVEETFTYPSAVVLGLRLHGAVQPAGHSTPPSRSCVASGESSAGLGFTPGPTFGDRPFQAAATKVASMAVSVRA
ncbi:hypothetical protein [Streptomyces sp. NPDC001139]